MPKGFWNGGRTTDRNGYVLILAPEHPNAYASGYVLEHRMVMADHLGRKLSRSEHVHHINGNVADNRLENLELLSDGEHARHHSTGRKWTAGRKKRRPMTPEQRAARSEIMKA